MSAFGIGFLYEYMGGLERWFEKKWNDEYGNAEATDNLEGTDPSESEHAGLLGVTSQSLLVRTSSYFLVIRQEGKKRLTRGLLKAGGGLALVMLVLVVGTFNVQLCLSVIAGLSIGSVL